MQARCPPLFLPCTTSHIVTLSHCMKWLTLFARYCHRLLLPLIATATATSHATATDCYCYCYFSRYCH